MRSHSQWDATARMKLMLTVGWTDSCSKLGGLGGVRSCLSQFFGAVFGSAVFGSATVAVFPVWASTLKRW